MRTTSAWKPPLGACLLATLALAAANPPQIQLHADRILASDLAAVVPAFQAADPDTILGYAPLPGVERRVSRADLLGWAEDLGITLDPKAVPDAILLSRKMRRLDSSEVRQLVVAAVAERYHVETKQVEVELNGFDQPLLPAEPLDFELSSPLPTPLRGLGRPATLTLRWTDPRGHSGNLSFRATARVRGSYAVAREALEARTAIGPQDFRFENGFLPGDPEQYALSSKDVTGQQLRQGIKAGEVLEKRMMEAALAVQRGDMIELRYRSPRVVLRTAARAEESGANGEIIHCRNLQSGSTVRARILDSRQAEVVSLP